MCILRAVTLDTAPMTASSIPANTTATPTQRLTDTLPHANEFIRDVLDAASAISYGSLAWPDINRLAARWLRPTDRDGQTNASQLGHAVVMELVDRGLIDAELTTTGDGTPMVARVLHPRAHGLRKSRSLAA